MEGLYFIGLDNPDGSQTQVQVVQLRDDDNDDNNNESEGVQLHDAFDLFVDGQLVGTISFSSDFTEWEFNGSLEAADQEIIVETLQRNNQRREQVIIANSESFTFLWTQNEESIVVGVVPNEGHYGVILNGEYVGDIELSEDGQVWSMVNYELDTALVLEIGRHIEDHYE